MGGWVEWGISGFSDGWQMNTTRVTAKTYWRSARNCWRNVKSSLMTTSGVAGRACGM